MCIVRRNPVEEVRKNQRALAFHQVATDLLAVAPIADKVQHIVLDLECGAHEEAELVEAVEIGSFSVRYPAHRCASDE